MTEDDIQAIEQSTQEQRNSVKWFQARHYRLTSSLFGAVLHRKPSTPPDALVIRIIKSQNFRSTALDWGTQHEPTAIMEYTKYQHEHGHDGLVVMASGFLVSQSHPFLSALPDGVVYNPSTHQQPFGFLEVNCLFSFCNMSATEACSDPRFFCSQEVKPDGSWQFFLKRSHVYFAQVQGQMAIGKRPWCDFVVYTLKGLSVSRITYDDEYWSDALSKLTFFNDNCVVPEIIRLCTYIRYPNEKFVTIKYKINIIIITSRAVTIIIYYVHVSF